MADLKPLIRKRGGVKHKLTNFITFLEPIKGLYDSEQEISQVTLIDLQDRVHHLGTLMQEFDKIQNDIEAAVQEDELEAQYKERDNFENSLSSNSSVGKLILQKYAPADDNVRRHSDPSINADSIVNICNTQNVKLPVIKLPKFNGEFNKWLEFKDTYVSLIHDNQSINDIQKYHYLRASLEGDASSIIQNLQLSVANYDIAWTMLCKRFDNVRLLVHNHVKTIFNMNVIVKGSSTQLRTLADTLYKNLRSLSAMGLNVEAWDTLLIYILTTKFDSSTAQEWEKYKGTKDIPTMKDMETFLQERSDMLESMEINLKDKDKMIKVGPKRITMFSGQQDCPVCKGSHPIYQCNEYLKMPISSKRNKVQELQLCYNCLFRGHGQRTCRSKRKCNICKQRHHTTLHTDKNASTSSETERNEPIEKTQVGLASPQISLSCTSSGHVLLSTITVFVYDSKGNASRCKALLDNGSQSNYISRRLQKRLQVKENETQVEICGINGATSVINVSCKIRIQSIHSEFATMVSCYVIPKITDNIPMNKVDVSALLIPKNIPLADPTFGEPSEIDLLIGAELFWSLLQHKRIYLGKNLPVLQDTKFGYLISGMISDNPSRSHCYFLSENNMSEQTLQEDMRKFWEIEELDSNGKLLPDEEKCEEHFNTTHSRSSEGRFIVRIPFKYSATKLGDSREIAIKRLLSLERRFETNPSLRERYIKFLQEYKDMNHMSLVKNPEHADKEFVLPHHGVLKETSITTKLRVVFNGSSRTSTGWSLNDLQYTGPAIQNDIIDILIRFRLHNVVVSADVTKMYRQILVSEEDRPLQRIVWRDKTEDPIQTYDLCTVTYGLRSAPYLALRCFKQLALEHEHTFPKAAKIIADDFYVDDLITGFSTSEEAINMCAEIKSILDKGCFPLRKWTSNSQEFLAALQVDEDPVGVLLLGGDEHTNTLGVKWMPGTDSLSYCIAKCNLRESITKRSILSDIAKLFDPIGLVSPCIITAKIIIQLLWTRKIDWDDEAPEDIASKWQHYRYHLHKLSNLRIPRHAQCVNPLAVEFHGFCDASQLAYGACIYLRTIDVERNVHVKLLIAKTRVAPLKTISIPRLELCSAFLLSHLMKRVTSNVNLQGRIFLWSDSQIVLCWLNTQSNLLQPFVAHRIAEIHCITGDEAWTWNHVGSNENPADLASRGVAPDVLAESSLWWNGPKWLSLENYNEHIPKVKLDIEVPEMKKQKKIFITTKKETSNFERFSTLTKLQRVTAYCLRFVRNLRTKSDIKDATLTVEELNDSLLRLIKLAQAESFPEEIALMKSKKDLRIKHNLIPLTPFLDPDGILRVGGRLKYSHLRFESKHPILLSGKHLLTKLIFEQEHKRLMHAGPQLLLANVRQTYWPTSGISIAKSVVRNCLVCFKFKPKGIEPVMAHLPEDRVTMMHPFNITGVDYAGPLFIKDRRGRACKSIKCYISLFICFTTKCIHLELVSELTSDAFLAALRRFISRRGKPSIIYSDNGTNFVGIQKDLKFLRNFFEQSNDDILKFCANDNITWKFIPPNSPHFGGLWESGVKSVKHHLHRVIGETQLLYEELLTVLIQIESIVNSRPLYPMSSDPNDLLPLTPAHFIIGRPFTTLPDPDVTSIPIGRLSRYQLIQKLYQSFWKRWSTQYLSSLQEKHKWKTQSKNLLVGTMVLIKNDSLPPCNWLLGRVTEVHPGKDNVVRVASIKTSRGILKRAVTKLCPLPISSTQEDTNITSEVK